MTAVTELQCASDAQQPGDGPAGENAELLSVLARSTEEADLAEEADLMPELPTEPLAGPPPGITKGIVYW